MYTETTTKIYKPSVAVSLVTCTISLLLIGFSIFLSYQKYSIIQNSVKTEGMVIDILSRSGDKGTVYAPVVEYYDDQTQKQFASNSYSNSPYAIGEKIEIFIPDDGQNPIINSISELVFPNAIPGFFGLIFLLISGINLFFKIKKDKLNVQLDMVGRVIVTDNVTVEELQSDKYRTFAYIIKSQWLNPVDGKVYVFRSEPIEYDPRKFLPQTMDVKILPDNPKLYRMDISKIPTFGNDTVIVN